MNRILITNNSKAKIKFEDKLDVLYFDTNYLEILYHVRDKIHLNYKLLTHPMAGSLKPNQTPFKSILLEESYGIDMQGLLLIENSIEVTKMFLKFKSTPNWPEHILNDFKTVDLSLVEYSVIKAN